MENKINTSLQVLLDLDISINIVDIGASYIPQEGEAIYKKLQGSNKINVLGFEPNLEALSELNKNKPDNEQYLPLAIADGKKHNLHICKAVGMTSIFEPNTELLKCFHGFPRWAEVIKTEEIETKRIDDIPEIERMDFLKLDIQGAELLALENAVEKLNNCLVVHTEVEFLPMYKGQPLFDEIFAFMRSQGFVFHNFHTLVKRMVTPLARANNEFAGLNQVFWADAVFIRDFSNFVPDMTKEQLLRFCILLHDIYSSFDIVLKTLLHIDNAFNTQYSKKYIKAIHI